LPGTDDRFAVTVPKRIGNAVRRNYARRRIREYYRHNRPLFESMTIIFHLLQWPENWDDLFEKVSKWANQLRRGAADPPV
jgi:ribonuclease P protein component